MSFYPVFLHLQGRRGVVVGGGAGGAEGDFGGPRAGGVPRLLGGAGAGGGGRGAQQKGAPPPLVPDRGLGRRRVRAPSRPRGCPAPPRGAGRTRGVGRCLGGTAPRDGVSGRRRTG